MHYTAAHLYKKHVSPYRIITLILRKILSYMYSFYVCHTTCVGGWRTLLADTYRRLAHIIRIIWKKTEWSQEWWAVIVTIVFEKRRQKNCYKFEASLSQTYYLNAPYIYHLTFSLRSLGCRLLEHSWFRVFHRDTDGIWSWEICFFLKKAPSKASGKEPPIPTR